MDAATWSRRLDAWMSVVRTQSLMLDHLERELIRETGLTLPRFDVLAQLDRAGGRLRFGKLADAILLSRGGLSRLVDRMARDGLITREGDPSDARGWFAVITPHGRELLARARKGHNAEVRRLFAEQIDDSEAAVLTETLRRVRLALPGGAEAERSMVWGAMPSDDSSPP